MISTNYTCKRYAKLYSIALLTHQAEMASFLSVIYSQHIGVEVEEGGVQRRVQPTPAAATQAANDAEAAMAYCRDEILPQLVSGLQAQRSGLDI
jgi:hypothetical protein